MHSAKCLGKAVYGGFSFCKTGVWVLHLHVKLTLLIQIPYLGKIASTISQILHQIWAKSMTEFSKVTFIVHVEIHEPIYLFRSSFPPSTKTSFICHIKLGHLLNSRRVGNRCGLVCNRREYCLVTVQQTYDSRRLSTLLRLSPWITSIRFITTIKLKIEMNT